MRNTPSLLCIAALITACHRDTARPAETEVDAVSQSVPERKDMASLAKVAGAVASDMARAESPAPMAANASSTQPSSMPSAHSVSDSVIASMIIRTGQASVQVDSLERGIRAVRMLATRVGGYVANSSISSGANEMHSATLEIKIPASHFDEAVNGLQPIGSLESVSVNAEDVGEEFVDVAARAQNGHKLELCLIDILGTRTGKLSDVLAIERELPRVREDIERQEGRMRYLRTRAAMSTLSITVHEKAPVVAGTGSG
ncbi:MAG: DUF4349 domain-containing protein, partial [Gemmatimonadota bacterium]|nr:DUF4349 domain-containing protein [Gemmatimonadota bacterium]